MKHSTIITAAVFAAFAVAGSTATNSSAATFPVLAGGPMTLQAPGRFAGYQMAVEATKVSGKSVVALEFVRERGSANQAAVFVFQLPQSALRIRRNLTRATLDTRSGLGRFGPTEISALALSAPRAALSLMGTRRPNSAVHAFRCCEAVSGSRGRFRSRDVPEARWGP